MSFNTYIDIDSSYRNREDYPNPADFMIISKQDNLIDSKSFKNPCSKQIILYPPFGTEPLIFYRDLSSNIVERQHLPYMYKTNDPHIIQLDDLVISPTHPEDIGEIIVNDLYPRGTIPLGQANQFYKGDYLENFLTKETREIISFTYETSSDIVYQSSQVLWSTVVGDIFKIGVSPRSVITIPPSNIYNYYRGKFLKLITGKASGFKSLITDYTIINDELNVFTLSSFSGILPQQGDIFQIVSDKRWYATIEYPFSTTIPAYPAYQEILPMSDIQFTSSTVYTSTKEISFLALSETRDILLGETTGVVTGGVELYNHILIQTADDTNYFWQQPRTIVQTFQTSIINYNHDTTYTMQFTDFNNTNWTIASTHIQDDIILYNGNIFNTVYSSTTDTYIGQVYQIHTSSLTYMIYVTKTNSTYSINIRNTDNISFSFYTASSDVKVMIHSVVPYNNDFYIVWSEYNNTTLTYRFSKDRFASPPYTISTYNVPSTFSSITRRCISVYDTNTNTYYVPIIQYTASQYSYVIFSSSDGISWSLYKHIIDLGTSIQNNSGVFLYLYNSKLYVFVWGTSGLLYTFLETNDVFSPFIFITQSNNIFDCVVSENSNGIFIVYTYLDHDNSYKVITLNTQQFQISTAVPYRIRKNPSDYILTEIPIEHNSITIVTDNLNTRVTTTGYKDILYGLNQYWYYIVSNAVFYFDGINWISKTFTEYLPSNISFIKLLQIQNTLYLVYSGSTTTIYRTEDGVNWISLPITTINNLISFNIYTTNDSIAIATSSSNIYLFDSNLDITSIVSPIPFKQTLWIPEWNIIVSIPLNNSNIVYSSSDGNTWNSHPISIISNTTSLSDIAYSSILNMLIVTTNKVDPNVYDFVYTKNLSEWDISYRTSAIHINYRIVWNSYFSAFFALSSIQSISNILFSMDGLHWISSIVNNSVDFDIFREQIGFITPNTQQNVYFLDFKPYITTNKVGIQDHTLINSFLWIYNNEYDYDTTYQSYNNIYQITDYDSGHIILDKPITVQLPFRVYFEILSDIQDCFNGINYPFNYNHDKCYNISIQDIILPNKVLSTYLGNQISFYPYIYIKITNEGANVSSLYSFMTNNPNATTVTFKIPVSQFTNDPSALPFIRLSSAMTIKAKFNLRFPFRFTVYLPNGDIFHTMEEDNITPDFPNPLLQISATIRITES